MSWESVLLLMCSREQRILFCIPLVPKAFRSTKRASEPSLACNLHRLHTRQSASTYITRSRGREHLTNIQIAVDANDMQNWATNRADKVAWAHAEKLAASFPPAAEGKSHFVFKHLHGWVMRDPHTKLCVQKGLSQGGVFVDALCCPLFAILPFFAQIVLNFYFVVSINKMSKNFVLGP